MSSRDQQNQARAVTTIRDLPIEIQASGTREESNSMGTIAVPADHYWGAQTQRSLIHFAIGDDHMPKAVYHAYGYVKKAAAMVNAEAGKLPREKADLISKVADEVIAHKALDENKTLREAALESGYIRAEEFDTIVVPAHMVGDPHKDLEETRKVVGQ